MSQGSSVDVAAAAAVVRESMAELDGAIEALRAEANRLRSSADHAMATVLLERPETVVAPASMDASVDDPDVSADEGEVDEVPAFGALAEPMSEPETEETEETEPVTEAAPAAANAGEEATVIEFRPREEAPEETEPVEPIAGANSISDAPPSPAPAPEAPATEDGLAAIEASESTEMPADWNAPDDGDDAAFAKFFSSEVEPEPAQRWLLNDL